MVHCRYYVDGDLLFSFRATLPSGHERYEAEGKKTHGRWLFAALSN